MKTYMEVVRSKFPVRLNAEILKRQELQPSSFDLSVKNLFFVLQV